jgi:hypothetical protein
MIVMKKKSYFCKHILQNLTIYCCGTVVTLHINTDESINHCCALQDVLIESEQVTKKGLEGKHGSSLLANSSTLKMEATHSSETSVYTRSTRRHIPEEWHSSNRKVYDDPYGCNAAYGKKEHHISASCRYQYKWMYHLRNVQVYAFSGLPQGRNSSEDINIQHL